MPSKTKDCQIPRKSQISTIQKSTSTIHWIPEPLPKNIPRLAERLTPFFQLLKTTDAKDNIPITPDIMKQFREINEPLDR